MENREELKALVKTRLEALGAESEKIIDVAVDFSMDKVLEHIMNNCNIDDLPVGLTYAYVDAVAGEYIGALVNTGSLVGFNVELTPKSIRLGDTTVETGETSMDSKFSALVRTLKKGLESELECYRKLRW